MKTNRQFRDHWTAAHLPDLTEAQSQMVADLVESMLASEMSGSVPVPRPLSSAEPRHINARPARANNRSDGTVPPSVPTARRATQPSKPGNFFDYSDDELEITVEPGLKTVRIPPIAEVTVAELPVHIDWSDLNDFGGGK